MKIRNQGFDHVEFVVDRIGDHARRYKAMGFEKVGERSRASDSSRTEVYAQGYIRILLTEFASGAPDSPGREFLRTHGDGICTLAVEVADATEAFKETVARGARPALKPTRFESPDGSVVRSEIYTPADLRYAFIERTAPASGKALFDDALVVDRLESPSPMKLRVIDHLTNNVSIGEMAKWVDWYKTVFDFEVTRHFDIRTGRTGLISDVVQSRDKKITVPINEATEPESQVQEFVERFRGPGVQHLALLATDLPDALGGLRKAGFKFLEVPHTYYEEVPRRVPNVTEDLEMIEKLGILLDGDDEGYLLQIFSEELVGPFFMEFIQRKNNKGFGEGNFRALFEAIERDQVRRGTLEA